MLSAASGAALIFWPDGKPVTIIDTTLLKLSTGGIGIFGWTVIIAAVVALIAHGLLFWTRFGTARAGRRRIRRGRHRDRDQHGPGEDRRSTRSPACWPGSARSC